MRMLLGILLGVIGFTETALATDTPHADGCFGGVLAGIGSVAQVARSIVHVAVVSDAGVPVISGTGVFMRNVRGDPRVVTAWHLVANTAGRRIAVVSSDAEVLGEAQIEVRGTNQAPAASETVVPGDLAVLKVAWRAPGMARGRGLLLAAGGRGGLIAGYLDKPAGAMPGVSGAPVLDPKGRVLAVVVARTAPGPGAAVEVIGGNLLAMHAQGGRYVSGRLTAPASSGFAAEVPAASQGINISLMTSRDAPGREWNGEIIVPAVVRGHCVVLQGRLAAVEEQRNHELENTNP